MMVERADLTALWSRKVFGEAIRFSIVGAVNVAFNIASIVMLTELFHLHYIFSYLIVFAAATLIGFLLNRSWSFGIVDGEARKDLFRYVSFTTLTLVVAITGIRFLDMILGNYVVAVAIVSALLAPVNFIVHRTWSFGQPFRRAG